MKESADFFKNLRDLADHAGQVVQQAANTLGDVAEDIYTATAPTLEEVSSRVADFGQQAYSAAEASASEVADFFKHHTATAAEGAAKVISLDEIGRKLASLGMPAIMFAVASSIAGGMGLSGAAVVTSALAMLGGPAGMIGGLISLGLLAVIADAVGKYGIEAILQATFIARRDQAIPITQLHKEIDSLWISDELKYKLKTKLAMRPD